MKGSLELTEVRWGLFIESSCYLQPWPLFPFRRRADLLPRFPSHAASVCSCSFFSFTIRFLHFSPERCCSPEGVAAPSCHWEVEVPPPRCPLTCRPKVSPTCPHITSRSAVTSHKGHGCITFHPEMGGIHRKYIRKKQISVMLWAGFD